MQYLLSKSKDIKDIISYEIYEFDFVIHEKGLSDTYMIQNCNSKVLDSLYNKLIENRPPVNKSAGYCKDGRYYYARSFSDSEEYRIYFIPKHLIK